MATLHDTGRTLRREDLPGAPSWIDPLLAFLNSIVTAVVSALTGNLTFGDNMNVELVTATATHAQPFYVALRRITQARGIIPLNANGQMIVGAQVSPSSRPGQASVVINFLSGSGTAKVSFLLTPEGIGAASYAVPAVPVLSTVVVDAPLTGAGTSASHLGLQDAGAAQSGGVNTAAQTFGGDKTFNGKIASGTANPGGLTQETWTAASLLNSWVADGLTPGYMKDSCGFVHLRGGLKNGTINANGLVLPAGYRPSGTMAFPCVSYSSVAASAQVISGIVIDSSGNVIIGNDVNGSNFSIHIDGIVFDTR